MQIVYNLSTTEYDNQKIRVVGLDGENKPLIPRFLPEGIPGVTCQVDPTIIVTEKNYEGNDASILEFFSRTEDDAEYAIYYDKSADKLTPILARLHPIFADAVGKLEITDTARAFFEWLWHNFVNSIALQLEHAEIDEETFEALHRENLIELMSTFSDEVAAVRHPYIINLRKGYLTDLVFETRCLFPVNGRMCSVYANTTPATLAQPGGLDIQGVSLEEQSGIELKLPLEKGDVFYLARLLIPIDNGPDGKIMSTVLLKIDKYSFGTTMDLTAATTTEGDDNVLLEESSATSE